LSTLLGAECGVTAAAVQQSACGELLKQTPEGALFAALAVPSLDTAIYLHAELATVLPMIDLLLGGAGAASSALRPLTDIEQEIFKPIVDLFAAELKTAWTPLVETSPRYAYHGMAEEVFPSAQRVLGLKFEIRVAEWQGTWNLILPSLLSTALIRKMEQQTGVAESEKSDASERRLRERLLDSRFRLELFLPPTTVSVRSLAHLKVGQVVVLKQPSSDPIDVNIDGVNLFQALPVSCGTRRGAQIKKIFPVAAGVEKEKGSS
jgi:flagellar motor switch protein FliM